MEIIGRVLDKLVPLVNEEVDLHLHIDEKAQTLVNNLKNIRRLLDDAESKQLSKSSIKLWLEKVQDLAYDVEDALDDWEESNRALQQDLINEAEEEKTKGNAGGNILSAIPTCWEKVCLFLHTPFWDKVVERRTVALDIKGLNERVKKIYDEGLVSELQLKQLLDDGSIKRVGSSGTNDPSEGSSKWRSVTTSGYSKSQVKGREKHKENIRNMLILIDDTNVDPVEVVCVVGQGGLGKTTLAQMVYDDDDVKHEFDVRMWVCVSDPFNKLEIARNILDQLGVQSPNINVSSPEALMQRVKKSLEGKKFLLVLDDVWTEESEDWEQIKPYLGDGGRNGSKILVTTRKVNTANAFGASIANIYHLRKMDDEECWSIISQMALSSRGDYDRRSLEEIGRKIAQKCDGLPLAARILGGLLKNKERNVRDWKGVLESEIWKLEEVENKLFRHFFLSYDELKPAVKRCFAYCAVFPKDFWIEVQDLIQIWMAQGLVNTTISDDHGDALVAKGYGYFKDLAQRSFFQDLQKDVLGDRTRRCKMHDIVHDFSLYLSRNDQSARHLWWDHNLGIVGPISNPIKLRSLFCRQSLPMEDIVANLKCVRALTLYDCGLKEIPEEIGNLIQLRYLILSYNPDMKELPRGICNLYNLRTLALVQCVSLSRFPQGISNLRNLRYLLCDYTEIEYPSGLGTLTNLQRFSCLYVRKGCNSLRYLKDLNLIREYLRITLRDTDDVEAAEASELWRKTSIDYLTLDYDEGVDIRVVDALRPHSHLRSVWIDTTSLRFPSWLATLENLKRIVVQFCGQDLSSNRSCSTSCSIPPLWKLPSLEHFEIWGANSCLEQWVGNGFYGLVSSAIDDDHHNQKTVLDDEIAANDKLSSDHHHKSLVAFPKVKTLRLFFDDGWRLWKEMREDEAEAIRKNNITIMPRLTELHISYCMELETLPLADLKELPSLQTLRIERCPRLEEKFSVIDGCSSTSLLKSCVPIVIFQ